MEFENRGLLEIICFAKRAERFERNAPGMPPRHDAQLRLVNAQMGQLRIVAGMFAEQHVNLFVALARVVAAKAHGCTLGFIGCARCPSTGRRHTTAAETALGTQK